MIKGVDKKYDKWDISIITYNDHHKQKNKMFNFNTTPLTRFDIDELEFGFDTEAKVEFIVIFNDDIDMKVAVEFDMDIDEGWICLWENTITSITSRDWNECNENNDPKPTNTNDLEKVRLVRELLNTDFIQNEWIKSQED